MNESRNTGAGALTKDGLSGLAAAAMLLPQAMAFGVALLTPFGVPAGRAALSGLVCAAALSVFSGLAGGTRALVSSPTGPMLILAASVLGIAVGGSAPPERVLLILAVLVVLTGICQMLIGITGGGRLIKFIPYSVTVGFLTGSAVLMLKSQYGPLARVDAPQSAMSWIWVPAATAAVTIAASEAAKRLTKHLPPTIAGLVAGTGFFHIISFLAPSAFPDSWMIGSLPGFGTFELPIGIDSLSSLPWPALVAGALAASVLASVDTLLTSVLADLETGERHDARKELVSQGAGHIASGLLGGMAGAGTTGATLVATSGGGRRWVGVASGGAILLVVLFGGGIGTVLPLSVLAGIIIRVSYGMFDLDILSWIKRRRSRADALIAILVATVTVAYDLLAAVGIGVVISIVLYLRAQVRAPVIHRRFTGSDFHSVCKRTLDERRALMKHAEGIRIFELRGDLFFATADRLFEELLPDLESATWILLNLRRVRNVDITGAKILHQIAERVKAADGELVFCEVHKGIGIGHDVGKTFRKLSPETGKMGVRTFVNTDEALEFIEDRILESEGLTSDGEGRAVAFSDMDIFAGLDGAFINAIEAATTVKMYEKDDTLFSKGDHGSALYFLLEGEVDIRLETTQHHYKRLAKYPAGTVFGEVAFLKPGDRTADAVAVRRSRIAVLSREDFMRFSLDHPEAAVAFLIELGKKQSEELRWSAHEIQRLGDW